MKHPFAKIATLLIAAFLFAANMQAQDVIHKKNGQILQTKVVELGVGEIKYRLFDQPDGPIYVVEKESIAKIIFQDGHTELYGAARMDDKEMFEGQGKRNLKVSFLGPLIGYTNIIYEQNIKPGRSWEAKACIVGLGKAQEDHPRGFIGSFAYKFYKKPTFYTNDMKRTHLLQGGYIKPEIFIGTTSYDTYSYDYPYSDNKRESSVAAGFLLNFGKQWVFDDAFVLDLSCGLGYGAGTSTRSIYTSEGSGFAATAGFNIGWILK